MGEAPTLRSRWINPVKHGLVRRVPDWPFSSLHRNVAHRIVPEDFDGEFPEGAFGEPDRVR